MLLKFDIPIYYSDGNFILFYSTYWKRSQIFENCFFSTPKRYLILGVITMSKKSNGWLQKPFTWPFLFVMTLVKKFKRMFWKQKKIRCLPFPTNSHYKKNPFSLPWCTSHVEGNIILYRNWVFYCKNWTSFCGNSIFKNDFSSFPKFR